MCGKIYLEIAKNCLNNWYPDMPEEKKTELLERGDFDELESYIGAETSIRAAIRGFNWGCHYRHLPDYFWLEMDEFWEEKIRNEKNGGQIEKDIRNIAYSSMFKDPVAKCWVTIDALGAIHNSWIRTNPEKYFDKKRRDKRFMFMPVEFIGWEEAKKDLIFLAPILEAIGFEVYEDLLEEIYKKARERFVFSRKEGMVKYVTHRIVNRFKDLEMDDRIIKSIRRKDVAQEIVTQFLAVR